MNKNRRNKMKKLISLIAICYIVFIASISFALSTDKVESTIDNSSVSNNDYTWTVIDKQYGYDGLYYEKLWFVIERDGERKTVYYYYQYDSFYSKFLIVIGDKVMFTPAHKIGMKTVPANIMRVKIKVIEEIK